MSELTPCHTPLDRLPGSVIRRAHPAEVLLETMFLLLNQMSLVVAL